MATQKVTYKNSRIEMSGEGGQTKMKINGTPVRVGFDPATGKYLALEHLAYSQFDSPLDLAKALIDSGSIR